MDRGCLQKRKEQHSKSVTSMDTSWEKEAWETKIRHKIQKEQAERTEKNRGRFSETRDASIESAIRAIQKETALSKSRAQEKSAEAIALAKRLSKEKLAGINDKKKRWLEKTSENVDNIRSLQEHKRRHLQTLKALEEYSSKLDNDIAACFQEREEAKSVVMIEEERISREGNRSMKDISLERRGIMSEVKEKRTSIESIMNRHKDKVAMIEKEHERDLEAIEDRVRENIVKVDRRINEIQENIEKENLRIQHSRRIMNSYTARQGGRGGAGGGGKTMML